MSSEPNPNPNPNNTVSHTTESTDPHKIDEEQSDGVVSSDEFTNDVFSASDEPRVEPAEVADESEDREGAFVNSDSDGAGELSGVCSGEVARDLDSSIGAEVSVDTRELNCSVSDEIPIDSSAEVARELVEPIQFSGFVGEGEAVQELTGRRDFEEVAETRELNGALDEAIPCDSVTDVARESVEPRQLSNVDLGIVSGDLGSSIEVEETREVNGAVDEGISGDSATEVARELVESRQLSDVDLGVVSESRERGDLEGEVEEAPLSPNSSGYAGGRGSSGSSIGGSEIDEIRESKSVVGEQGESALDSQRSFEKGHKDEDDASISWRKRKKHFLILSHSGKPIFSRYGDEHKLAGFSATLQAIISFVENGRDRVKLVRAGNHQVVFLVKGPIYLVCISSTEETYESLKGQLELLYGQMILILTKSVNKCFEKNPKFDMTPLLGGTDAVFSSLFQSFNCFLQNTLNNDTGKLSHVLINSLLSQSSPSCAYMVISNCIILVHNLVPHRNPATFLHAYTCVPLAYATRQAVGAILQEVANSGILFSLIMCKHKVVSLAGAQKASLHPDDMLLLANFVVSSESFRTSEAFSPICLPRYNPFAFLHAYVHYFDEDIYLVMLTASSEAFYHLKDCRMRIEAVLLKSNVLAEVHRSMMDGGMRVEDFPVDRLPRSKSLSRLGRREVPSDSLERHRDPAFSLGTAAGLLHFMYRSTYLEQYVSSEFASPINNFQQQKRLYRAYQKLYLSVHQKENGPHKTHFRRDENYVLLCWVTQEFEFYAAFDPLADMAAAIKICNRVCQWVKDVETDIFLSGGGSFSW